MRLLFQADAASAFSLEHSGNLRRKLSNKVNPHADRNLA